MAAGLVQVAPDSSGKKIQTFENTISANVVEAQAIVPVDSAGAERTSWPVTDNAGSLTVDGTVTANQGGAPWSENVSQIGGSAVSLVALPSGGFGQAAVPVNVNALRKATYIANAIRVASGALTAATRKDICSIEHAVSATKTVRIRRILVSGYVSTASAAAVGTIEWSLFYGTAASSAGTSVAPSKSNQAAAASEAVFKTLPTIVAATQILPPMYTNAANASGLTIGSLIPLTTIYDYQEGGETEPITLRAGVLESLVIGVQSTTTPALTVGVQIIFTEE